MSANLSFGINLLSDVHVRNESYAAQKVDKFNQIPTENQPCTLKGKNDYNYHYTKFIEN